jgi:hypothetical protein
LVIPRTSPDPLGSVARPHHSLLGTFNAPLIIFGIGLWSHAGGTSFTSDSAISGSPLILVSVVFGFEGVRFEQGPDELKFLFASGLKTTTLPIILIFTLNALVFVPLGDLIGSYFRVIPPLRAYSWDICGAIAGTVIFGLLSYFWFSPIFGFALVMIVFLSYCRRRAQLLSSMIFFILIGTAIVFRADTTGIWSPYNLITMREMDANGIQTSVLVPRDNIANLTDPPFYTVQVNHDFYMLSGTIDRAVELILRRLYWLERSVSMLLKSTRLSYGWDISLTHRSLTKILV